jgi:hypothetical protein
VIVSLNYRVPFESQKEFTKLANEWLIGLQTLPGWISGTLGRSVDEVDHWLITQTWQDIGSCRRGLSKAELRPTVFALAKWMISEISTYEPLLTVTQSEVTNYNSDRSLDADSYSLGQNFSNED